MKDKLIASGMLSTLFILLSAVVTALEEGVEYIKRVEYQLTSSAILISIILILALFLSIACVFLFRKRWIKISSLFALILFSIINLVYLPQILRSSGQGDGLPEVISAITALWIAPILMFFSAIWILALMVKDKSLKVKVLSGAIFGGVYVAIFYILSQLSSHPEAGAIFWAIPVSWPLIIVSYITIGIIASIVKPIASTSINNIELIGLIVNEVIFILIGGLIAYLFGKRKNEK